MPTQETQAADVVNTIIQMTSTLYGIGQQINQLATQWTNLAVANKINAFPTAPLTTTGGINTSLPDTNPVTSNPINTSVSPGTEIDRAISANSVAGLLTYLQGVANVINGQAVSANGAAAQLIAQTL